MKRKKMRRNRYFHFCYKNLGVHMTFVEKLIRRVYPNKIITYRISDLVHNLSTKSDNNYICISIETDNNSRRFCYLTLDELINVYRSCPVYERSLYELICAEQHVKAYIDYEYYITCNPDIIDSRIGPICCLKIFHLLLDFDEKFNYKQNINTDFIFENFLILEA